MGVGDASGDYTTWSEDNVASHTLVQDPPKEEEDARAIDAIERGVAPSAIDCFSKTRLLVMNSAIEISFRSSKGSKVPARPD